jgi:predicted nucleic acid-binding protein
MPDDSLIVAEPAGVYARRPPLVVDCSVLAAVLFDEAERESAASALAGKALFAPDLIDHELASVALKKSRAGLVDSAERGLSDLVRLALSRKRIDPLRQWAAAVAHDLTAYDAAYLQLAIDMRAPLVTFDKKLGDRARAVLAG